VVELSNKIKQELMGLVDMCNKVKIAIQLSIPRIEDGNNFGVSIQVRWSWRRTDRRLPKLTAGLRPADDPSRGEGARAGGHDRRAGPRRGQRVRDAGQHRQVLHGARQAVHQGTAA